ncbi:tryptophan transporter [Paenisporosarcina cavernae]|uniref:Tryptophan transporter n=1 Tax=Paenisporosarcina cavernae TaxID=2320858 RepID=A0A385YV60_9BACL|nr:tryptophan transporter [Paenisporosarcina cavernae]AYC30170.1 tryptophan transporter [Paenisporosarcina cavernae]
MNTKQLVLMSMLIALGTALYLVIPGFNGGMKPDFMLTMMFIGILLFPKASHVFLLGTVTGILSGLFSTFPAGFIPNVVDKVATAFLFYIAILLLKKVSQHILVSTVLTAVGTILSGSIFLSVAIFLMGVNVPFIGLFLTVVLPAVALNALAFFIMYPIVLQLMKRSNMQPISLSA